mgnify:FL=1|tara:strand:+ start:490 stop:996 length:507 start_codon:yes stop_codon:yes gene_type:complete
MAISVVQKYLDLALSAGIGNKSGTDSFLKIPNDLRKLNGLKVADFWISTGTVTPWAGGGGTTPSNTFLTFEAGTGGHGLYLAYFSHPVEITYVNHVQMVDGVNLASFNTSCYMIYRDRAGSNKSGAITPTYWLGFANSLSTSTGYVSRVTGSGQGTDVDYYALEIKFE